LRKLQVFFVLIFLSTGVSAQDQTEPVIPKRVDIALAEAWGSNVLIWSFNRYIREDNYSFYISWRSIERNLRHGFEWDPNNFATNFFAHPYHGNIYFNAGRTNGLNFWESTPIALTGSFMWEVFMESEFPSYNDLVMTTTGGIALGESLFRLSEQVLDDRARGASRVWRETAGFLINPVGGFNRVIRGDMFQRRSSINHIRNPLTGYLAAGSRGGITGSDLGKTEFSPSFEFTMFYGEPFKEKQKRKPFDYFNFRFWTSKRDTIRNMTVLARAVLVGKNFTSGQNQQHLLGLFQYFDYIDTRLIKLGGTTLGPSLISRFPLGKDFNLNTAPALGVILLGAGDNEYATSYQGLNYNYGWGWKGKFDFLISHTRFGKIYVDYNFFTIYARSGALGTDRVHVLDASYILPLWKGLGVGAEYFYYYRSALYDDFPDVKRTIKGIRALLVYQF
jgi:hypothetical protein